MTPFAKLFFLSTLAGLAFHPITAQAAGKHVSKDEFFLADTAVLDTELDEMRGAAGTSIDLAELSIPVLQAVAVNNTTNGGFTGNNLISDTAFNNSNGVSLVVQNSGNNAVINAALVVNLSIQ